LLYFFLFDVQFVTQLHMKSGVQGGVLDNNNVGY
jgi:hypothetical protein